MARMLAGLDMYRKVPVDLLEGSRQGSIISWIAILIMITLFVWETKAYFEHRLVTDLSLDQNKEKQMKVHFNITMVDLTCEYATIDVVSVMGKEQNVTKNVQKWTVDASGIQQRFVHRNMMQHDVELHDKKVTDSLEQLHKNGEDALSLDEETLRFARDSYQFLFVDFFASWCSHCRQLAPTWETFAEVILDAAESRVHKEDYSDEAYKEAAKLHIPVLIAKVDCVIHHDLCMSQAIMGYPTLRLFVDGEPYGDYFGHRTIMGLTQFLAVAESTFEERGGVMVHVEEAAKRRMGQTEEERQWAEELERSRHNVGNNWNPDEHPGCQLSGILLLDRAPSHFYIQARSPSHELAPHMTNVSHIIHELSFTDFEMPRSQSFVVPNNFEQSTMPMNDNVYITNELHEAHHHYLKLVSTNLMSYQVLQSSQLALYTVDQVPEAKFIIDLSPIAVTYTMKSRPLYDYITSLMAIIGGTFTVVGMLESGIRKVTRPKAAQRGPY